MRSGASIALWVIWSLTLIAMMVPRSETLTALRIVVPAAVPATVLAALSASSDGDLDTALAALGVLTASRSSGLGIVVIDRRDLHRRLVLRRRTTDAAKGARPLAARPTSAGVARNCRWAYRWALAAANPALDTRRGAIGSGLRSCRGTDSGASRLDSTMGGFCARRVGSTRRLRSGRTGVVSTSLNKLARPSAGGFKRH